MVVCWSVSLLEWWPIKFCGCFLPFHLTNRPTYYLEVSAAAVVFLVGVTDFAATILAPEIDLPELVGEVNAEASEGNEEGTFLLKVFALQVANEGLVFGKGFDDPNTEGGPVADFVVAADAENAEGRVGALEGLTARPEEAEGIDAQLVTQLKTTIDVTASNVGTTFQLLSIGKPTAIISAVVGTKAEG